MVSNILGHCILPYPLLTIIIVTTIIVTMIDNNVFGFNKCFFLEVDLASRKKQFL